MVISNRAKEVYNSLDIEMIQLLIKMVMSISFFPDQKNTFNTFLLILNVLGKSDETLIMENMPKPVDRSCERETHIGCWNF